MPKTLLRLVALVLLPGLIVDPAWASASRFRNAPTRTNEHHFGSQALANLGLGFSKLRMRQEPGRDAVTMGEVARPALDRHLSLARGSDAIWRAISLSAPLGFAVVGTTLAIQPWEPTWVFLGGVMGSIAWHVTLFWGIRIWLYQNFDQRSKTVFLKIFEGWRQLNAVLTFVLGGAAIWTLASGTVPSLFRFQGFDQWYWILWSLVEGTHHNIRQLIPAGIRDRFYARARVGKGHLGHEMARLKARLPTEKPVSRSARSRMMVFALMMSGAVFGMSLPVSAQTMVPAVTEKPDDNLIDSVVKPMTREQYELFQRSGDWGAAYAEVTYEQYLADHRAHSQAYVMLRGYLEAWRQQEGYGKKIWQMLTDHPHPIVISSRMAEGFGGQLVPSMGVLILNSRFFDASHSEGSRLYGLVYYLSHELLHELHPDLPERDVHAMTLDLIRPIAHLSGFEYSRMLFLVERARQGNEDADNIVTFRLNGDAQERALQKTLGMIDPAMNAVSRLSGIPIEQLVFDGMSILDNQDIVSRDAALLEAGRDTDVASDLGFAIRGNGKLYWAYVKENRFEAFQDPSTHTHVTYEPFYDDPVQSLTGVVWQLVSTRLYESTSTLADLRRSITWMVSQDPASYRSIVDLVERLTQEQGWRDETQLHLILRKDTADHWTIETLKAVPDPKQGALAPFLFFLPPFGWRGRSSHQADAALLKAA